MFKNLIFALFRLMQYMNDFDTQVFNSSSSSTFICCIHIDTKEAHILTKHKVIHTNLELRTKSNIEHNTLN